MPEILRLGRSTVQAQQGVREILFRFTLLLFFFFFSFYWHILCRAEGLIGYFYCRCCWKTHLDIADKIRRKTVCHGQLISEVKGHCCPMVFCLLSTVGM